METKTTIPTEELAVRYGEAWNAQDLDAIMALHSEGTVFHLHVPGAEPVAGRAAVREAFEAFLAQLPDINFATKRLHAGPHHWVLEATLTGSVAAALELAGEALDAPGARVEVDSVDVVEVREGLVARKETYLDAVTFQQQLGVG